MPRAIVSKTTETFELTTVPKSDEDEAGFVELRRLSYGEKLRKDAEAMKMKFAMDSATGGASKGAEAEVSLINEQVTLVEFAKCIMAHNLTDENDRPLNFQKPDDVRKLDPRVGDEISSLIGDMNDFEKQAKAQSVDGSGK